MCVCKTHPKHDEHAYIGNGLIFRNISDARRIEGVKDPERRLNVVTPKIKDAQNICRMSDIYLSVR